MPIPEGFGQVTHVFSGNACPTGAAVVYGVDVTTFPGPPSSAVNTVHGLFATFWKPQATAFHTLQSTIVKYGPDATGPSAQGGTPANGTSAGLATSPNVTYLIQKLTAFGGKSGRGRMYLPGTQEADVGVEGNLLPAKVTALQTAANTFLAAMEAALIPMVLLHQPGAPIESPTIVNQLAVQGLVATQRKRLRR